MKVCFPVTDQQGLASELAADFRSAPALLIVDSETGLISSPDPAGGSCQAMPTDIDAVVFVKGMGRGMFNGLTQRGIRVFSCDSQPVQSALSLLAEGKLQKVEKVACCGGGHHHAVKEHAHDHAGPSCCGQKSATPSGNGSCGCGHH